ncbi:DUF4870 domain-containing protein [Natronococcus occultus]|uniref:DUF4870 domain-containing protein n=1 Tax=Natronococcus occultus SP4 TaxID=694430 RepID=L0K6U2_9EURY|nr:DUF4870 domain-containing protein [Natronococcus occultus]AGB39828.1 hypothetical protein Natoc_4119 [Natronococcus occultus SP4]
MTTTPTTPSPEQSKERSLGGILVHPLALFTSFIGAAIMYVVSDNEFTKENARHALNWHITVVVLAVVAMVIGFFGADEATIGGESIETLSLPGPIDTVLTLTGILLLLAAMIAVFATFAYTIIATQKAISGSAWSYPGAIEVVGRNL